MTRPDLRASYPPTRRDLDSAYTKHGRRFEDPYAWLEKLDAPEVRDWIGAQEHLTRTCLDAVPARAPLADAVLRAARYERKSPPIRAGAAGREFYWHARPEDEKPRFLVRRAEGSAPEVLLDPNTWAAEETLVFAVPSPDGSRVAFGHAKGSTHHASIRVLDVETGCLLDDRPRGTDHASVAWRPDSRGFFYAACPEVGEVPAGEEFYWNAVYEHELGASDRARKVYGNEQVKEYWCSVKVSECGRFAVLCAWDFVHANVVHLLRLSDRRLIPVALGMRSLQHVQVLDDALLIRTDLEAPRGRACLAPLANPTEWRTILPEGDETLQTVSGVAGRLFAVTSHGAAHRVRVYSRDGVHLRELELPALGSVNRNDGEGVTSGVSGSWRGNEVWVNFTSFVQPPSTYRYDFDADRLTAYHVPTTGIDPTRYATERVWYRSPDGTPISMFLVHRDDLPRDGRWAVRLTGYGGYNIPFEPGYSPVNAAWLQMGGAVAVAHVRGGGEYGRAWHEAARGIRKQASFDDFIAAARWLVAEGYTTPGRIVARGNSNGGLLVAASAMQAPDAFGAVFCRAPLLDLLRFTEFGYLNAAIVEHGSPDDPVEGPFLAGISPYHGVRADRAYPPMAFVAALNDRVAPPHDPLKLTARLQAEAKLGGPYLLLPLRASGHAGGTTMTALVAQDADELSFYFWALGLAGPKLDAGSSAAS